MISTAAVTQTMHIVQENQEVLKTDCICRNKALITILTWIRAYIVITCKVLDQPDIKDTLHKLHANYVLVPADKAANNVIVVCKKYYIDTLVKELGINNINRNNPTYIPIDDSFETIIKSHNQFITSVGLEMS